MTKLICSVSLLFLLNFKNCDRNLSASMPAVDAPPRTQVLRGLNFVAPPKPFPSNPMEAVKNVNADWNSSSGDSEILNKPTIPSGNQVIDWTQDQGATNIHPNNYTDTNTTYVSSDFDHDHYSDPYGHTSVVYR